MPRQRLLPEANRRRPVPPASIGQQVEIVAHEDLVVIRQAGAEIVRYLVLGPSEVVFGSLATASRQPKRRKADVVVRRCEGT